VVESRAGSVYCIETKKLSHGRDACPPQTSEATHPAIRYVESQFLPLLNRPISDGDLWNLLSSGTEPIVDAVLYMLPHTGIAPFLFVMTARDRLNLTTLQDLNPQT
jgi:hypothetical protein